MTNITDHVTSLELSKRLKELGVKQKSIFMWVEADHPTEKSKDTEPHLSYQAEEYDNTPVTDGWTLTSWSSYLASELGEMLLVSINGTMPEIIKGWNFGETEPKYCARYFDQDIIPAADTNMANAIAKCIIHLIENDLVDDAWRKKWLR